MNEPTNTVPSRVAAAVAASGIGALAFGIAVVASEASKSVADTLNWYKPTGPLSGKTTIGIVAWLVAWAILGRVWKGRPVKLRAVAVTAMILIGLGFLLTFPPVFDAIAGKG